MGSTEGMTDLMGICSKDGCGRNLTRVHDATGIDAEGRVGPLWTCKDHRTELWMKVGDDLYDAKIRVLGEMVKHHVKEEEEELFPEAASAKMDVAAVGKKLAARKEELMSEMA